MPKHVPFKEWSPATSTRANNERFEFDRGLVGSVRTTHSNTGITLYNRYPSRVKPDIMVHLYNKDGVRVFDHQESWVVNSLDAGESTTLTESCTEFPFDVAFSRWAILGGASDRPTHAWVIHETNELTDAIGRIERQSKAKDQAIPKALDVDYSPQELLPDLLPYSSRVDTSKVSEIVDSLRFKGNRVTLKYNNRTPVRIKPDIRAYVLNGDGVILDEIWDSWSFLSLDPGEKADEEKGFYPSVPEALLFSRWADYCYDPKPAYVWFAGDQRSLDRMISSLPSLKRSLRREWVKARTD